MTEVHEIQVPVLIVGGGGSGLAASLFLSDLGVRSLLVERHPSTSVVPKAHYVNQRSMEIFRHHGVDRAIYDEAAPRDRLGRIEWRTSIGGDGPLDGKVLIIKSLMGGGDLRGDYDLKGVTPPTHIPQIRLEPILRRLAEQRNPGGLLFGHELIEFSQDAEGVEALIREIESGQELRVRAQYLLGADAGKTVGPAIGATMVGMTNAATFVGVYFTADLSRYFADSESVMRMIVHPQQLANASMTAGALLTLGPDRWDEHSEEWLVAWAYPPHDSQRPTLETAPADVQAFLKVDVPIEVKRISHWQVESIIADKFADRRVLLIGDAAHKHTPAGGLGLNSGIQDAHNLSWKLAAVLGGQASEALLATYEPERRPVVSRNAELSVYALGNHGLMVASMGIISGAPPVVNEAQIALLLAQTADGEARRERMHEVFQLTRTEYSCQDMELGFQYVSEAIVDDGTPLPKRDPLGSHFTPSTHPGCRLPHAWVSHDGACLSTHDLLPVGGFLLIAGENGAAWVAAAQRLAAQSGICIRACQIGAGERAIADPSKAWTEVRETDADGAILVRPDGHVGWRARAADSDPLARLSEALKHILATSGNASWQTL
jgi:2,4-dichlorophenol 6-monooxygenase